MGFKKKSHVHQHGWKILRLSFQLLLTFYIKSGILSDIWSAITRHQLLRSVLESSFFWDLVSQNFFKLFFTAFTKLVLEVVLRINASFEDKLKLGLVFFAFWAETSTVWLVLQISKYLATIKCNMLIYLRFVRSLIVPTFLASF